MTDQRTLENIKMLHPKLRGEALMIYEDICKVLTGKVSVRFISTFRSFAEQDALYAQGRTKPGKIVTNARGGTSFHNYGLAIDICLIQDTNGDGKVDKALWDVKTDFDGDKKADWIEVVQVFKQYGWEAGIDWHFCDPPHFQKTFGFNIKQLQGLHSSNRVDKNGFVLI